MSRANDQQRDTNNNNFKTKEYSNNW